MSVPRHTSAYGVHRSTHIGSHGQATKWWSGWGDFSDSEVSSQQHTSFRGVPVKGTITASGFKLPTDWAMLAARVTYGDYNYECRDFGFSYRYRGNAGIPQHGTFNLSGVQILPNSIRVNISPDISNRANVEALNKIKDQKINVGTALGESMTTLRMLSGSIKTLVQAVKYARRGRWRSVGQLLGYSNWKDGKGLSNSWLQYQYGWMPLLSDIYGAQEQLKAGFREKDQIFKVSRQITNQLPLRDFVGPPHVANNGDIRGSASEICKVVYFQKVSNPFLLALNQLGLVNPLSIAWELTPFSFVIDWLLPIGNFLDGLTAALGTTFVAGYEDRLIKADVTFSATIGQWVSGKKPSNNLKMYAFQRIALNRWSLPLPYVKNPFSTTHVTSALALLRQLRK